MSDYVVNVTRPCLAYANNYVSLSCLTRLGVVHHVVVDEQTVMPIVACLTDCPHKALVTLGYLPRIDIGFLEAFITPVVLARHTKLVKLVTEHNVRLVQFGVRIYFFDAHADSRHHLYVRFDQVLADWYVPLPVVLKLLTSDTKVRLYQAQLDAFCWLLVCPIHHLVPCPDVTRGKETTEGGLAHLWTGKDDAQVTPVQTLHTLVNQVKFKREVRFSPVIL